MVRRITDGRDTDTPSPRARTLGDGDEGRTRGGWRGRPPASRGAVTSCGRRRTRPHLGRALVGLASMSAHGDGNGHRGRLESADQHCRGRDVSVGPRKSWSRLRARVVRSSSWSRRTQPCRGAAERDHCAVVRPASGRCFSVTGGPPCTVGGRAVADHRHRGGCSNSLQSGVGTRSRPPVFDVQAAPTEIGDRSVVPTSGLPAVPPGAEADVSSGASPPITRCS